MILRRLFRRPARSAEQPAQRLGARLFAHGRDRRHDLCRQRASLLREQ